jgi:GT2 family glycosyltransferase
VKESVAVLIVHWNSSNMLQRCLECIVRQESITPVIFVLDNGSDDPIPEELFSRFPSVQFHKSEKNTGFAAGNNLLFQKTIEYEWIALVNPDAFLEPAWLKKMISMAGTHLEYSFFASRLVREEDHEILDGDGDTMHISGLAWREGHSQNASRAMESKEVFSPCAAAALYKRDVFESAGGFDEDFFCYFEDVDLGFRLRLAGHRCLLVPDAVAYHVGSVTTGGRHSDFAIYHGHRNLVWTYVKDMPGALFWLLLPLHIALNLISIFWFFLCGKGRVILRAKYDAIGGIPRMWGKRRSIQKNRKVSVKIIWKALDKRFCLT